MCQVKGETLLSSLLTEISSVERMEMNYEVQPLGPYFCAVCQQNIEKVWLCFLHIFLGQTKNARLSIDDMTILWIHIPLKRQSE